CVGGCDDDGSVCGGPARELRRLLSTGYHCPSGPCWTTWPSTMACRAPSRDDSHELRSGARYLRGRPPLPRPRPPPGLCEAGEYVVGPETDRRRSSMEAWASCSP